MIGTALPACLAAVLAALCASPSPAHAQGRAVLTLAAVNAVRAADGEAPLTADPAATSTAAQLAAASETATIDPNLGVEECDVCDGIDNGSGSLATPATLYAAAGGTGTIVAALTDGSHGAQAAFDGSPATLSVLDPRAIGFGAAATGSGLAVVVVALDTSRPIDRLVTRPEPLRNEGALSVIGPAIGPATLAITTRRGGAAVTVARLQTASVRAGERLYTLPLGQFGDGTAFAYARPYTLVDGRLSLTLHSAPQPVAQRTASFRFGAGMTASRRAFFLATVRRAPAPMRQVLAAIDGGMGIIVVPGMAHQGEMGLANGDGSIAFDPAVFGSDRVTGAAIIDHELGHEIQFFALDKPGFAVFSRAFHRSPAWRCVPDPSGIPNPPWSHKIPCVSDVEIFADQVAYWANGDTLGRSGYGDRRLLSASGFTRLIQAQIAPFGSPLALRKT
jgi:hypothetical protein